MRGNTTIIILAVIVAAIVIGGGMYVWTRSTLTPTQSPSPTRTATLSPTGSPDVTAGWKTYIGADAEFQFQYPTEITVTKEANGKAHLVHSVPYGHADFCNLKESVHLDSFTDFDVTIRISSKSLAQAITETQRGTLITDILENGEFKVSAGFIDEVTIGSRTGHRVTLGAEGCGIQYHYFPVENGKILVVEKTFVPELDITMTPSAKTFLALPGIILPSRSEQIFTEIVSSIALSAR